jgi:uncharacterized membrane protein
MSSFANIPLGMFFIFIFSAIVIILIFIAAFLTIKRVGREIERLNNE